LTHNKTNGHVKDAIKPTGIDQCEMQSNMPDTTSPPETIFKKKINGMKGQKKKISYEIAEYKHYKTQSMENRRGRRKRKKKRANPNRTRNSRSRTKPNTTPPENNNARTQQWKRTSKGEQRTKNIWEILGYIKPIPGQTNTSNKSDNISEQRWKCQIENCTKTNNNPDNLAKHIAKMHKDTIKIKLQRQKVKCPQCNTEYSNAVALLKHMQITKAEETWKPMFCEIITKNIIPPEINNIQNKWNLIQKHNSPETTAEQQQQTTNPYIQQLQKIYENQTTQKQQIMKWNPPEPQKPPRGQKHKRKQQKKEGEQPKTKKKEKKTPEIINIQKNERGQKISTSNPKEAAKRKEK